MKIIIAAVIACIALAFGGVYFFKPELLPFGSSEVAEEEVKVNVPLVEIPMHDVLIPINIDRRQRLLLADLSLFVEKPDQAEVEGYDSKIKHKILSEFSVKPDEYYMSKHFITAFQSDLEILLIGNEDANFKIKEVLVTKAVYQ